MKSKASYLILILLLFFNGMVWAESLKIVARVDRNPVAEDEPFTYEIEISGPNQDLPEVEPPEFEHFALIGGPSVSTSFQMINFKMSASRTYSFVLQPREKGEFVIPAVEVEYKGKTIRSNAVKVVVTAGSGGAAADQSQKQTVRPREESGDEKLAFLRVVPSRREVYINQEVLLRYKIYFRTNINNYQILSLPEAAGCWVEEYPIPQRPRIYSEVVNGVTYNVAEIKKIAVFPSRSGSIKISPLEMEVETVVRKKRRRRSLFDDFFEDPFGQMVQKKLSSGAVTVNVKPLPLSGRPDGFDGLVGDYKISGQPDKLICNTNEGISYKIKISGEGLLKFLNQLPLKASPDFEIYEPKVTQKVDKTGGKIVSSKEFEYVLVPRVAGKQKIEAIQIPFFNPRDGRYHTLRLPEVTIQVNPGKETAPLAGSGTMLSKREVTLIGRDIRFIKERSERFYKKGEMPYKTVAFYLGLLIPLVILGGAVGYRKHLDRMESDQEYARHRTAGKQAKKRLKEARKLLKEGNTEKFYGEISRALIGFVADKTNRPAAGLMRNDVEMLLREKVDDAELNARFLKLLDEADFKRFAPAASATEGMQEDYRVATELLTRLEKYFR
ncbi:MAG: hypothetical protein Kow0037_27440 [Calditrichia bacterium]